MPETQGLAKGQQQADVEATLLGDKRDRLLDEVKRHFDWKKLTEAKQASFNAACEQVVREIIRDIAWVTAGRTYPVIPVSVGGMKAIKDGMLEAKVVTRGTEDTVLGLFHASRCILVLCDHDVFMGESAPAPVDKQQPDLMETAAEREKREAIDKEAAEHEASIARARQFKPLDDAPPTIDNDSGAIVTPAPAPVLLLGAMLPPAVKDAADRGVAHRQSGGARTIPRDLEGKVGEASAWLKGYDMADASADGQVVDGATGEVKPEPAKPPKGHRGKRTSTEERTAKRLASVGG